MNYFVTSQATVNCMSKIEVSQKQTQILMTALNADPSEISKYAQGSPQKVFRGVDGQDHIKSYSPSDIQTATYLGRKKGESDAKMVFENLVPLELSLLEQVFSTAIPEFGEVFSAASNEFDFEGILRDSQMIDKIIQMGADIGAADGLHYPEKYLEPTGDCPIHGPRSFDPNDGTEYPNPYYKDPDVESHHEGEGPSPDPFETSGTELDTDPEIHESPPTHGGIDDPPDVVGKDESIVDMDPEVDKGLYMKQCVEAEERNIINVIGTKRKASDEVPITQEGKKQKAEREL